MIKPDTLWSFLKQSEDGSELTVGRVCRSLAGHDIKPPLDRPERLLLKMIVESNEWHTKAVENERERKRAAYERKKAESPQFSKEKAASPQNSAYPSTRPPIHPSFLPSVQDNNTPSLAPSGLADSINALFERFWDSYPRKQSKKDAMAKFSRLFKGMSEKAAYELFDKIMGALDAHRRSDQWVRDEGRYIPYPATWLNQARWNDELAAVKVSTDETENAEFERRRKEEAKALKEKTIANVTVIDAETDGRHE